jgi:hypothetical protein
MAVSGGGGRGGDKKCHFFQLRTPNQEYYMHNSQGWEMPLTELEGAGYS